MKKNIFIIYLLISVSQNSFMTDFIALNQEVQSLFEQSNQPHMYFPQFKFNQSLDTIKNFNVDRKQSIKRIMNFINVILYLKTNKLKPCQIKFNYVGRDPDYNWGLKHVICYRTLHPPKTIDSYDNTQFLYHADQDNQLVWSLGKLWLRFYTDKKITPIDKHQSDIDQVIDKNVTDSQINKILKKMLKVKKDQRITFQKFIQDEVFAVENFHQNLYSSICIHFQNVSKNQKTINSLNNKRQIKTPYEQQIFRRDLEQSLSICQLLQKNIQIIRNIYQKSVQIQFHCFIIKAQAYCILKQLDQKKTINQISDNTIHQKKLYSKFVTKMLTLKEQLERKMRMQIFNGDQGLNQDQKKFLIPTNQMSFTRIHPAFKNIIINYYIEGVQEMKQVVSKPIKQDAKIQKICSLQKRCLLLLLGRLSNQIFSQLRSHIFEQYLKRQNKKILKINQLLEFIDNCNDYVPLRIIRNNVYMNGLQAGSSNAKR